MSLQNELDTFMANVRTQLPAEVLAPVEAFYADLGLPDRFPNVLRVGQMAPDFTLADAIGKPVSSASLRAQGPMIISFYRGAWCPFCNIELRSLQAALPQFRELGATLVAISPEKPDFSVPMIERENLAFGVLSDPGNQVAKQFGLVYLLDGEARRVSLETFGTDLPTFNGDESWELPVPATYVIDRKGMVKLAFFDPEFRNRVEPRAILEALRGLS
jgi:peroxiredoxin